MALTEEELAQILGKVSEAIEDKLSGFRTEIGDQLTSSTKGVAAKLQRDIIPRAVSTAVNKAIDDMLTDIASDDDSTPVAAEKPAVGDKSSSAPAEKPAIDPELQAQITKMQAALQTVTKNLESEQKRAQELEAAQRKANMRSSFIQEMKADGLPQIINPDDFFDLLNVHGKLVEQGDKFVLKTGKTDNLGEPVYQSVTEALPDLIKDQRYSIYVSPRSGTGTGGGPASQPPINSGNKYVKPDELPSAQDIYAIMQDPARKAEFLAEAATVGS